MALGSIYTENGINLNGVKGFIQRHRYCTEAKDAENINVQVEKAFLFP